MAPLTRARKRALETRQAAEDEAKKMAYPVWTSSDESTLIQCLLNRKAKKGTGFSLRRTTWDAAEKLLEKCRTKGGLKTRRDCRRKWREVDLMSHCFYHAY
jgi:hypothetical protein